VSSDVTIRTTEGGRSILMFGLDVGGQAVEVTVYWAEDEDGELHREWSANRTLTVEEKAAIDRWFAVTGLAYEKAAES
jgi:hypothetical protein